MSFRDGAIHHHFVPREGGRQVKRILLPGVGLLAVLGVAFSSLARSSAFVVGEVVSSTGEKIPGASVTLEWVGTTRTDALGRFRFRNVPPGNYRITASREGFSAETRHLPVLGDRRNEIVITLSGAGPLTSTDEGAEVVVPIERRGVAILVKARLNDRLSGIFIVDTGATLTVISHQVASSLGIRADAGTMIPLQTVGGMVQAPLVTVASIKVGQAEAKEVEAVVHDIPNLPPQITGLLGLSFLRRFKVNLDVENQRMILGRPE